MFRIVLASALALAASACSSNDPIANMLKPAVDRTPPPSTAFYQAPIPPAVVIAEPVVPVPEVAEVIPPYVPTVYVPEPVDPCQPAWRNPDPCNLFN